MGCGNSHTKGGQTGTEPSHLFRPQEDVAAAYKAYREKRAAEWEILCHPPNPQSNAGIKLKRNPSNNNKNSKIVRGITSTLIQCVPCGEDGALLGRGINGEVRLARVMLRVDETDVLDPTVPLSFTRRTVSSISDAHQSDSAPWIPVQELYVAAVKEWQLPPSAARGNSNQLVKTCHNLVKEWRRQSVSCEGLMHCIGAEMRDSVTAGALRGSSGGGGATSGSSPSGSFAVKGPRFRVYLELCRFGHLLQYREAMNKTYGTSRLHELTARALLREVLMTLLALHREGCLQYDLTPRAIFLQHPVEVVYGSLFPMQLGESLALALAQQGNSSTNKLVGSQRPDPETLYQPEHWNVAPGAKQLLASMHRWDVAVDVPVASTFAYEPPVREEEVSLAGEDSGMQPDDTPVPPTISTHQIQNQPHGGLALLVPHKYSGPVMGYMSQSVQQGGLKCSTSTSVGCGVLQMNQNAMMAVLESEGRNHACPGLVLSVPPPMLMVQDAPHTVTPTVPFSPSLRPRFATRLLHAAEIRRALQETTSTSTSSAASRLSGTAGSRAGSCEVPLHKYLCPPYVAPEVLIQGQFSEESDIYAWAITFIELTAHPSRFTSSHSRVEFFSDCFPPGPPPRTRAERWAHHQEWCNLLKHYYTGQITREHQLVEQRRHDSTQSYTSQNSGEMLYNPSGGSGSSANSPGYPVGCHTIAVRRGMQPYLTLYPAAVQIPSHLSTECQTLLLWCLQLDPLRRPSASELLTSPYFRLWEWITSPSCTSRASEEILPEPVWRAPK